ncbi:transglutaminase-like domain-containing protein [Myxococcota bacterium]|nr:transglutaminase-like domain-containing protein [Myxococcota bacterium]
MEVERVERVNPIQTGLRIAASALRFQHNLAYVNECRLLVEQAIPEHEDLGHSVRSRIAAVHAFVSEKVTYIRDPKGIELHYSPERIYTRLLAGESVLEDCDSFASLTLAMLWALGVQSYLVLAGYQPPEKTNGRPRYQHVFAQAYQPAIDGHHGRWVAVDPSLGKRAKEMCKRIHVALIIDPFRRLPAKQMKKKKGTRRASHSHH